MLGIGHSFSGLPANWAHLAGAAILAGAAVSSFAAMGAAAPERRPSDDTAFAIPRVDPRGMSGISLPQPLPPSEAARIRRVFALQSHGDLDEAQTEAADIDTTDPVASDMLGHILAQRFLGRFSRPGPDSLRAWLERWPTLPDAPAMHALLLTRLPKGTSAPPAPPAANALRTDFPNIPIITGVPEADAANATAPNAPTLGPVPEEIEPESFTLSRNPALDRSVRDAARTGGAAAVERLLDRTAGLSKVYASQLRGEAAQILFTLNRDVDAFALGSAAMHGCGPDGCEAAALGGKMAGLAAWRLGRPEDALPLFEAARHATLSTAAQRSASAFWAARTHLRLNSPAAARMWFARAADEPRTFYGLIARRVLGIGLASFGRDPRETLSEADIEAVAASPYGLRAFALIQVGQYSRAEAELRRLWPDANSRPTLGRAIMLVAQKAGLSQLAAQLADLVQASDGRPRDATRFPIPRLQPQGGFKVDPAMVYGITRTESNFNTALVSPAGATGLMQIMPDTAGFLTGQHVGGEMRGTLRDPAVNLDLGQRYVAFLAQIDLVGGDLLKLLACYNSGPGNFSRWSAGLRDMSDPLMFIEAIPIDETRGYVPRVLTYTWIYASRMHLPTPSLDELAGGGWPRYHALNVKPEPPAKLH